MAAKKPKRYEEKMRDRIRIRTLIPGHEYSYVIRWGGKHPSPDGSKQTKAYKAYVSNWEQAWNIADEKRRELERGPKQSVEAYVSWWWERYQVEEHLQEVTIKRKQLEIDRIIEFLGFYNVDDLTPTIVSDRFMAMRETVPDYSRARTFSTFNSICTQLVDEGVILRNPCATVKIRTPETDAAKREEKQLTPEQCIQLAKDLADEEPSGCVVALWLQLATGMRRGESLGLKWCDFDASRKSMRVARSLNKQGKLKRPKANSGRTITLDDVTVQYLVSWKQIQKRELKRINVTQDENTPICNSMSRGVTPYDGENKAGNPETQCKHLSPDSFARWRRYWFVDHGYAEWRCDVKTKTFKYGKRKGQTIVRPVSGHGENAYVGPSSTSLRHAQATLLLLYGNGDVKSAMGRLGHKRSSTLMQTYAELTQAGQDRAADVIGRIFNEGL